MSMTCHSITGVPRVSAATVLSSACIAFREGRTVSLVVKGKVLGARRAHFAHPAGAAHETGHGPETAWHANGKWAVAEMVQQLRIQAARLAKSARNAATLPKTDARRALPPQPDLSAGPYVEPPARVQKEPLQLQEQLRRQRDDQQDIELEQQRQQQEQGAHAANKLALLNRQRLLTPTVVHEIADKTGVTPWSMDEGDFELAMGVSIIANSKTVAIICPVASRITSEVADRLLAITIYVASEQERRNIARCCRVGQKIIVIPTAPR
jgi:hypothetical protein